MTLRFDDAAGTLDLGLRDLLDPVRGGPLALDLVQRGTRRLAAGRAAHLAHQQGYQADARAEVRLAATLAIGRWQVTVHGRVDGLADEAGHTILEEIKSTALPAERLLATGDDDWRFALDQLDGYLWLAARAGYPDPQGRLVLLGLLDGARHILARRADLPVLEERFRARAAAIVRERERRAAWLDHRRARPLQRPFTTWRAGQPALVQAAEAALQEGVPAMLEAPTGAGKTAAVLYAAVGWATPRDRRVFWATGRNTQAAGVLATAARLANEGDPLRVVALASKERACLNDVVACRPDVCRFAAHHDAGMEASDLRTTRAGVLDVDAARALGETHQFCPWAALVEAADRADVVVGDANYVLAPMGAAARVLADPATWVVVGDEAHTWPDRARDHASPRLTRAQVREALAWVDAHGERLQPWRALLLAALDALTDAIGAADGPLTAGEAVVDVPGGAWSAVADAFDDLAFDLALAVAELGLSGQGVLAGGPLASVIYAVYALAASFEDTETPLATLVDVRAGSEAIRRLCLDPTHLLQARLTPLGGLLLTSATLHPADAWRARLGLPEGTRATAVPSPFPPERALVRVVTDLSTAFRHRERDRDALAARIDAIADTVPGNVAVFFGSFAHLDLLAPALRADRTVLRQTPGLSLQAAWDLLDRLATERGALLLAVLGGMFAEGVDLPAGALSAVVIVGPGLPPPGLERTLVQQATEARLGHGFFHSYTLPGMTRVVQAAGRLVRREADRGAVVLIDPRFDRADLRRLMPDHWQAPVTDDVLTDLATFFAEPSA
jgi:DNA excision repair protein ERCC-2